MKFRIVSMLAAVAVLTAACGDDDALSSAPSTSPTTTQVPATTTTTMATTTTTDAPAPAPGACSGTGVGAPPAGAYNLSSSTGDFDGDGNADTFSVYGDGADWYAHFSLANGYQARAVIAQAVHPTGTPGNGPDIIADPRISDMNADGRDEAWLFDTIPAARIILSSFVFVDSTCQPFHMTHHDTGMPQAFLEGASGSGTDGLCFVPDGLIEFTTDAAGVAGQFGIIRHTFVYDDAIPAAELFFFDFIDPAVGVPGCLAPVTVNPTTTTTTVAASPQAAFSGCSPGAGALPDGEWFGFAVTYTPTDVQFDLACWYFTQNDPNYPNDFYIVNNNPQLRSVPTVSSTFPATRFIGGGPTPETVDYTTFVGNQGWYSAQCPGPDCPVVITVAGGDIVEIEHWYIP